MGIHYNFTSVYFRGKPSDSGASNKFVPQSSTVAVFVIKKPAATSEGDNKLAAKADEKERARSVAVVAMHYSRCAKTMTIATTKTRACFFSFFFSFSAMSSLHLLENGST